MRLKRLHYFVALIILAALVALVAFFHSTPAASGIGFGFIAYTNSPSGSQYALFGVTNFNKLPIQRLSPGIEFDGDRAVHAPEFDPALPWLPRTPLEKGHFKLIAIRVPPGAAKWRLRLQYQSLTIPERLRDYVMRHGHSVPLSLGPIPILGPPQYHSTNSEWITN
jgi:hypothetical protein